ncbi:MAG TPA: hypothetical protein PKD99_06675 [Sphingopyxis sp.]|nr:hypothetical protein [Sphingopyxis sp.]HMP44774.1 hypothetical protein [Sphingopyxis sp.]HMQ18112.1 hypothetical protein [Sphingopyxis sp.]
MRIGLTLAMLLCSSPAVAQSAVVLDRITRAAEICRASITAPDGERADVWTRASDDRFVQAAPDQPYGWTGEGISVRLAPGIIYGAPACEVGVTGSFRPTAVISAVGTWARAAGFVAKDDPRLLFSMETEDLYLDARRVTDGLIMEFGWRDD